MIKRFRALKSLRSALTNNPVALLLGPRQCGKTTLARHLAKKTTSFYFDLERPGDCAKLANPEMILGNLDGLVIIDEAQRIPGLFPVLRYLVDSPKLRSRFLLLGSASPDLVKKVSESLAGRIGFVDLGGFEINDVGVKKLTLLWLRGGFPKSFLARNEKTSVEWRQDFIRSFLERDIPQLGIKIPSTALLRFWTMVAHYHGQIWNGAELSRALGLSEKTIRNYLDLLTAAFVLRQLPPWFENVGKRQYKAPKVYIRDSGLLHSLLGIEDWINLAGHPKFGASWEGFAIEQILSATGIRQAFFWGTHSGAELDLLLIHGGKRYGIEFKCTEAPTMTKSLHIAMHDLKLQKAWIVYPGKESYLVHEHVQVCSLPEVINKLSRL